MTTHPICDDAGATDDRGLREGHLRSHEVAIRFSQITRHMMEIETYKWYQTTWLVKPFRKILVLTYIPGSWPDLDLTWVQNLNLTFQCQKVYVLNRLDEAKTMSLSYLSYKKKINEKPFPWKPIIFHFMTSRAKTADLMSNLIEKRYGSWRELSNRFFFLPSYNILEIIAIVCENIAIFSKFDLLWPLVTSILTSPENDLCKSLRSLFGLSNAVCRLSLLVA